MGVVTLEAFFKAKRNVRFLVQGGRLAGKPGLGFARGFHLAHALAAFGLVGERLPCRLGSSTTFPDMFQGRRFRLDPRLFGTGEEEVEVRITNDWPSHLLGLG